ncbi:cation diffusion facilitator family transporter [Cloacibacterium sp.]|uniref:cation diffusion facilitator family transporter n=1 Tax=Cloacibacterium sp. TaxID=1913682 RepID=UPI0039E2D0D2
MSKSETSRFSFQKNVAIVGIILFVGKLIAWHLTNSDAVFSDAMESIVNIVSAFMGLYSLYLAARPKDENHPYGHGKVEFVTSGVEGSLIIFAGIIIIIEAFDSLLHTNSLKKLDYGIFIVLATAIANYIMGYISIQKGKKENSLVLISSGKHLQSDTITTFGVVASLVLVYFTKIYWIDAGVAFIFGLYIIFVGYKIVRKSLSGIMDEADPDLLKAVVEVLAENRKKEWIDIHNMKIQQYGSGLHIDAHITLPWYNSLRESHQEMENIIKTLVAETERNVEFNFHMDDCKPHSCEICQLECTYRLHEFKKKVNWNSETISQHTKHSLRNNP